MGRGGGERADPRLFTAIRRISTSSPRSPRSSGRMNDSGEAWSLSDNFNTHIPLQGLVSLAQYVYQSCTVVDSS